MRIGDASCNETLHRVDVLAVEHLEYVGIVSDPRHFIGLHISTWYQPAKALHRTPTPTDELLGDPGSRLPLVTRRVQNVSPARRQTRNTPQMT